MKSASCGLIHPMWWQEPPLSLCLFNSLSLSLSQSLKSLSPGFSEQKEAPTGGSPFSVTHEMMRTTQPTPTPSLSSKSTIPVYREEYFPHCSTPPKHINCTYITPLSYVQWCGLDHRRASILQGRSSPSREHWFWMLSWCQWFSVTKLHLLPGFFSESSVLWLFCDLFPQFMFLSFLHI